MSLAFFYERAILKLDYYIGESYGVYEKICPDTSVNFRLDIDRDGWILGRNRRNLWFLRTVWLVGDYFHGRTTGCYCNVPRNDNWVFCNSPAGNPVKEQRQENYIIIIPINKAVTQA